MTRLLTIVLLIALASSLYFYISRTHAREAVESARDRVARVEAERAQLRGALERQTARVEALRAASDSVQAVADSVQAVAARRAEQAQARIERVPLPPDSTCTAALQYARQYADSLSTW